MGGQNEPSAQASRNSYNLATAPEVWLPFESMSEGASGGASALCTQMMAMVGELSRLRKPNPIFSSVTGGRVIPLLQRKSDLP